MAQINCDDTGRQAVSESVRRADTKPHTCKLFDWTYQTAKAAARCCIAFGQALKRGGKSCIAFLKEQYDRRAGKMLRRMGAFFCREMRRVTGLFGKIGSRIHGFCSNVRQADGLKGKLRAGGKMIARGGGKYIKTIGNYLLPAACIFALILTVRSVSSLEYGVKVTSGGQMLGYVKDEAVFHTAQQMLSDRIVYEAGDAPFTITPEFSVVWMRQDQFMDSEQLTDAMLQLAGDELTEGYGLYIDDIFYGAVEDKSAIEALLKDTKAAYQEEDPDAQVGFVHDFRFVEGLYLKQGVKTSNSLISMLKGQDDQEYTIREGDVPAQVAARMDIDVATLQSLNADLDFNREFTEGQTIVVSEAQPYLSIKVTKTTLDEVEIDYKTVKTEDDSMLKGLTETTQQGEKGCEEVLSRVEYIDGVEINRVVLNSKVVKEPVDEQVLVGTMIPVTQTDGGTEFNGVCLIWPVESRMINDPFGSDRRHKGVDIGGSYGLPICAAADGVIETAGWSNSYGNHVIIDHGNGVETLYGHMAYLSEDIAPGMQIQQGTYLGGMGQTGQATGIHLHFELRFNGSFLNALDYVTP